MINIILLINFIFKKFKLTIFNDYYSVELIFIQINKYFFLKNFKYIIVSLYIDKTIIFSLFNINLYLNLLINLNLLVL